MPALEYWRGLHELITSRNGAAAGGGAAAAAAGPAEVRFEVLLAPILHEILQLVMHLLLGVMQTAEPDSRSNSSKGSGSRHSSSSSSSSSSGGYGSTSSTGTDYNQWNPSPGVAATVLSFVIALLLPLATQAVLAQQTSSTAASSSSKSSNKSLAGTWVPLLLGLTAALEQGIRFEAQFGPTKAELESTELLGPVSSIAKDVPRGSGAWLASFILLSPAVHDKYGWMFSADEHAQRGQQEQTALLHWMLDNTPPSQLPIAQQRVLSLLCTTPKVGVSAEGRKQLTMVHQSYRGIFSTAEHVLNQLLSQQSAASSTIAMRAAVYAADAAATPSSSSQTSGRAAPADVHKTIIGPTADAVMSWLSLLGRCFLQLSQHMSSSLKQRAAGSDTSSSRRQQGGGLAQQRMHAELVSRELCGVFDLAAFASELPQCIMRVAVLLAAAGGHPHKQLPKPIDKRVPPGLRAAVYSCLAVDDDPDASASSHERQLLQDAGMQLAEHCSSIGLDLTAMQDSTWTLAEATIAAAPVFNTAGTFVMLTAFGLWQELSTSGAIAVSADMAMKALFEMGLTKQQASEVLAHPFKGVRSWAETIAAGLLFSSPAQAYLQQLKAAGLALSALPTAAICNNPRCSSLSGASERGVSGKACSACHLAVYCQRSCQKQHWDVHKPVCKAVQAATAAAAAAEVPSAAAPASGGSAQPVDIHLGVLSGPVSKTGDLLRNMECSKPC
jgi:hypothetical protein